MEYLISTTLKYIIDNQDALLLPLLRLYKLCIPDQKRLINSIKKDFLTNGTYNHHELKDLFIAYIFFCFKNTSVNPYSKLVKYIEKFKPVDATLSLIENLIVKDIINK